MKLRRHTLILAALSLASCATPRAELGPDHPASPEAAEGQAYEVPALTPIGPSSPAAVTPEAPASGTDAAVEDYTCTMHPQIHLPQPGNCPICGMTLVLHRHEP